MKSKVIKQRNIPNYPLVYKTVSVKPVGILFMLMIFGVFTLFTFKEISLVSVLIISISIFCLIVLPDAKLIEYTDEYVILYNCQEKDECKIIYWDEILMWEYITNRKEDELSIKLIDNSFESINMYKKSTVIPYFRKNCGNKERKVKKK